MISRVHDTDREGPFQNNYDVVIRCSRVRKVVKRENGEERQRRKAVNKRKRRWPKERLSAARTTMLIDAMNRENEMKRVEREVNRGLFRVITCRIIVFHQLDSEVQYEGLQSVVIDFLLLPGLTLTCSANF